MREQETLNEALRSKYAADLNGCGLGSKSELEVLEDKVKAFYQVHAPERVGGYTLKCLLTSALGVEVGRLVGLGVGGTTGDGARW